MWVGIGCAGIYIFRKANDHIAEIDKSLFMIKTEAFERYMKYAVLHFLEMFICRSIVMPLDDDSLFNNYARCLLS